MPLEDGVYVKTTKEEILDALKADLQNEFHIDIDLTESSIFSTLAESFASVLAAEQEQSIKDVYDSAFLETAEGIDLDRVVELIGIQRLSARKASGVVTFRSDSPVSQDYVISSGTAVQTNSDDPVAFETAHGVSLAYYDGFESGALRSDYQGDTASFSVQSTTVLDGAYSLEGSATGVIFDSTQTTGIGGEYQAYVQCASATTNGIAELHFLTDSTSDTYRVVVDADTSTLSIEEVVAGSATVIASATVTIPTDERLTVTWTPKADHTIEATVIDSAGNELETVSGTVPNEEYERTEGYFGVGNAGGTTYYDTITSTGVGATVRAVSGGAAGNVGSRTLTVMPSPPTGVDGVTNRFATGTPEYTTRLGSNFAVGRDRESDDELRERARKTITGGGTATVDAVIGNLVNNDDLPTLRSVTLFNNRTTNDNTGSGGLPPKSFECVVYGGTDQGVAEAIFEVCSVTDRTYGGAHGTGVSVDVEAINGQTETIHFSRPTALDVDFTIDIVVEEDYIGDNSLRDLIVEYVGGVNTDGADVLGTGVGEDVYISQVEDVVVGPDTGVRSITSLTTTPSITTNANNEEIVDVGSSEVAQTDGTDGSITLNVTEA